MMCELILIVAIALYVCLILPWEGESLAIFAYLLSNIKIKYNQTVISEVMVDPVSCFWANRQYKMYFCNELASQLQPFTFILCCLHVHVICVEAWQQSDCTDSPSISNRHVSVPLQNGTSWNPSGTAMSVEFCPLHHQIQWQCHGSPSNRHKRPYWWRCMRSSQRLLVARWCVGT